MLDRFLQKSRVIHEAKIEVTKKDGRKRVHYVMHNPAQANLRARRLAQRYGENAVVIHHNRKRVPI